MVFTFSDFPPDWIRMWNWCFYLLSLLFVCRRFTRRITRTSVTCARPDSSWGTGSPTTTSSSTSSPSRYSKLREAVSRHRSGADPETCCLWIRMRSDRHLVVWSGSVVYTLFVFKAGLWIRIGIQLFTLMRIRIQLSKIILDQWGRLGAKLSVDPDPVGSSLLRLTRYYLYIFKAWIRSGFRRRIGIKIESLFRGLVTSSTLFIYFVLFSYIHS